VSLLIRQSLLVFLLRLFDVSFSSDRPAQAFKDDKITHILQIRKHYRPKISHFGRKISCELDFWSCKRAKSGTKVRSFFGIRKFFYSKFDPIGRISNILLTIRCMGCRRWVLFQRKPLIGHNFE